MSSLTVRDLFERFKERLSLEWVAGKHGAERQVRGQSLASGNGETPVALVGHMNLSNPNRVQVLGAAELRYLQGLQQNLHQDALQQLFADQAVLVIVAESEVVSQDLRDLADSSGTPLFMSAMPSHKLVSHLQYFLSTLLAGRVTLHGVFMEVKSIGVLITGETGMGKSELAFELISRGHRLIADDAPEFSRISPDTINGVCPPALDGFLEVRGLGVLNIRAMFGDNAIKQNKYLRLIINLKNIGDDNAWELDRLHGSMRMRDVLDIEIPEIILPVAPGRNIAVLVEGAALNHILHLKGYDAAQDFIDRQQRLIEQGEA